MVYIYFCVTESDREIEKKTVELLFLLCPSLDISRSVYLFRKLHNQKRILKCAPTFSLLVCFHGLCVYRVPARGNTEQKQITDDFTQEDRNWLEKWLDK